MRALTSTELDRMQNVQDDAMPDTCTIQEATVVQDGIGQPTRSWSARATGVACRLAERRADERIYGEKVTALGDWVLTVAHDETVETGDRVLVDSRTFEVVSVNTGRSWETATRVGLVEVV